MRSAPVRTIANLLGALLLALASVVGIVATADHAAAGPSDDFISLINGHRGASGTAALAVDGQLMATAQAWAQTMANDNNMRHRSDLWAGTPAGATSVGENVGFGGDVASIFNALVNSPGHNANMLNGAYTHVGVGVAHSADGHLYTAHIFVGIPAPVMAPAVTPPPPPPPPPPAPAPAPAPAPEPEPAPEPTTTTVAPEPAPATTTTVAPEPATTTSAAPTTTTADPRPAARSVLETAAGIGTDGPGGGGGPAPVLLGGLAALGIAGLGGGVALARVRVRRPLRVPVRRN